jgi:hypothetical protein
MYCSHRTRTEFLTPTNTCRLTEECHSCTASMKQSLVLVCHSDVRWVWEGVMMTDTRTHTTLISRLIPHLTTCGQTGFAFHILFLNPFGIA